MQLARWGNGLAIRMPSSVAEELGFKEGDDVRIRVAGPGTLELHLMPAGIVRRGDRELSASTGVVCQRTSASTVRERTDEVERSSTRM